MNLRDKLKFFLGSQKKDAEYIELAYLESTGTQWIDSGVIPTENHKIEVVGYSSKVNTSASLVGTRNASNYDNRLQIWSDVASGCFSARINSSSFITDYPSTVKSTIVLDIKNKNFTVNNSEAYVLNYTGSLAVNSYGLFLRNNGNGADLNYADPVVIYSFKIWENNKLIRDLIPVLDKDLTPCMYDKVTGKFFYNQGTGEFKWKLPNQLQCLESDGNQYLLTDYFPNSNTAVEVDYFPNPSSVFTCIYGTQSNGYTNRFYALISSINYQLRISSTNVNEYYGLDGVGGLIYNGQGFTTSQIRVVLTVDNYNKLIRTVTDNGTVDYDMTQFSELGSLDCHYPLVIFNRSTAGVITATNGYKGRIYSFKIWESDKLLHYYIPVFDEELIPCMYDLVSKQYLRNQGTGAFKGYFEDGSQIVSYLSATGTQWIDTGITPLIGDELELKNVQCIQVSSTFQTVFSAGTGNYQTILLVNTTTSTPTAFFKYFTTGAAQNIYTPFTLDSPTTIRVDGDGNIYYNDTFVVQSPPVEETDSSMRLFYRANDTSPLTGNIGAVKIKRNEKIIMHLLPVVDSNGTACMLDLVSKKYFYNVGSGNFSYG